MRPARSFNSSIQKEIRDKFEKKKDLKRTIIENSPFHESEQALINWIHLAREKKIALNDPMVQEKATEFAGVMGVTDLRASGVWLNRFKKRENLEFKAITQCRGLND